MKLKNQLLTAVFRVFMIALAGVFLLSPGNVSSVQADSVPDLEITMTDSGDFAQGGTGTYTITLENVGSAATSGTITLDDFSFNNGVLTDGALIDPATLLTATGITPPAGWACDLDSSTTGSIICTSNGGTVLAADGTAVFTLTVNVAVDAPISIVNEADVNGGGDINDTNNSVNHPTPIAQKPDLTIAKTESGDFEQRGVGIYTLTVTNSNAYEPTDGSTSINVTYDLPTGLTLKTVAGTNWTCDTPLTCTRTAGQLTLNAGDSFEPIILTVDVAVDAPASVTTEVAVSGGGQVNTLNDTNDDSTAIVQKPDLSITSVTIDPYVEDVHPANGEEFVLHVSGTNLGGAGSGSTISIYAFIDPDPWPLGLDWDPGDYLYYTTDTIFDHPIGAGENFDKDITISGGLTPGLEGADRKIYVYVDPNFVIAKDESSRDNNIHEINLNIPTGIEYAINGNVGLAGVTLSYKVGEQSRTEISVAGGDYEFFVPEHWNGTVKPTLAGYVFSPLSKSYDDVTAIQTDQNYKATKTLTYKSNALQDGYVLESSENSSKGGTFNKTGTTLVLGDDAQKKQYRSILSFNTGTLPNNATITSVTLKIRRNSILGVVNPITALQGIMVDVRKGFYGTSALAITDFQAYKNKTVGPFKPALVNGWYSMNLINAKAYVNKLGTTQLRLRFKLGDNNNTVANQLKFYSGNSTTAAYRPKLVIKYTIP